MLRRLILCGGFLYLSVLLDQGVPVWIKTPAQPSFLSLLLVMLCQTLRGTELVAWTGAVGLAWDFLAGETPGPGVMTAATLGLLIAWRQLEPVRPPTFLDRLLSGLGLLLLLALVQGLSVIWHTSTLSTQAVASTLLIRTAATCLLFVIINSLWCGIRSGRRSFCQLEIP